MSKSKTNTTKSAKGSVVTFVSHDRLQLRFRFGGKRRYLSLALSDTPIDRRFAQLSLFCQSPKIRLQKLTIQ